MLTIGFICLIFGCFSGLLAGLFGLGGGLILVPFFIALFEYQQFPASLIMLMAVATSLATVMITASIATLTQHRLGTIIWRYVFHLSAGISVGVIAGSLMTQYIEPKQLRLLFALYMLYTSAKMILPTPQLVTTAQILSTLKLKCSGLGIGFMSVLIGIGGGSLTVPLLIKYQLSMPKAIAISSACGFPIAVLASISYIILGWQTPNLPAGCFGYIYLPAFIGISISSLFFTPIGAKLANTLPTQQLKRGFAVLLLVVAIKLMAL